MELGSGLEGPASDVAAGSGQAFDKPRADGVDSVHHHDRDRSRGFPRRRHALIDPCEDDVDLELHKLGCRRLDQVRLVVCRSVYEHIVASLDIPELAKCLLEFLDVRRHPCRTHQADVPDLVNFANFLRLGGERRGEQATGQAGDERTPLHYSITWVHPPIVDDPRPSLPGALHHLTRALIEVSGRVHRVGGITELITRLQHKVLTCHPELRHSGDEGDNQMHRMRVLAPRPPSRVGLDVNVGIPARDPLGANDVAVQGYCEFALLEGRRSAVLRLRDERRGEEAAGHGTEELPPFHYSITWSARASTDGGMVRPRALAVLRLMTSSNFVGCSTGRSPGLAPLRILST